MRISRRIAVAGAAAAITALALTSCSGGGNGGGGNEEATDENKPEKLTVAAWMDFPPELLASFEEEH